MLGAGSWVQGRRAAGGRRREAPLVNWRMGRKFGLGVKRRALPMPPTAQEMASELHAWRGAAARSRSTVKGGAAGPASPAGAAPAHRRARPSDAESRRPRRLGWPGPRSQSGSAGCPPGEAPPPPLCLAASPGSRASCAPRTTRRRAGLDSAPVALGTCRASEALSAGPLSAPEGRASPPSSQRFAASREPPFPHLAHRPAPLLPPPSGIEKEFI